MKHVNEFLNDQLPKINKVEGQWNRGYDQAVANIKRAQVSGNLEDTVANEFNLFEKPGNESQWKLGFWSAYYDLTTYTPEG